MPVNSVSSSQYGAAAAAPIKTQAPAAEGAEKKAAEETAAPKTDSFVKQPEYKPDMQKVYSMKADLTSKVSAFKTMVQSLFQKQGGFADAALAQLMDISAGVPEEVRLEAQAAIAEDGEWGVEKTAQRILDFAKALSGGDPSKIGLLKNAVDAGFKAAERLLGGTLLDISQRTHERVMEGFREWENGGETAPPVEEAAAAAE